PQGTSPRLYSTHWLVWFRTLGQPSFLSSPCGLLYSTFGLGGCFKGLPPRCQPQRLKPRLGTLAGLVHLPRHLTSPQPPSVSAGRGRTPPGLDAPLELFEER